MLNSGILKRLLVVSMIAGASFGLALIMNTKPASALTGADFQAGRIIDDGVFFNGDSLSASQVQAFLDSKLPSCDTNGSSAIYDPAQGDTVTRKVYSERRAVTTPFTCLKDYRQDVPAKTPEDALCNGITARAQQTAAQIIDQVSRSCGVSQKVLLVLLQKEQSLVTDEWPWPVQYRSATGYGCPDTAPCDEQYYGFFNQTYMAARVYKYYAKYPLSFNHISRRTNNVLYNPNSGCGSSPSYIENQATAGLYNYTPYQPNPAALNNLYGTGDGCSAYGNRNFWRMFRDWFGTTYASGYETRVYSQSPYPSIYNGETKTISIKYTNLGFARWYDDTSVPQGGNPVHLAATSPINRSSVFSATWPSTGRSAVNFTRVYESNGTTLAGNQHAVEPGQIAEFEFQIKVGNNVAPGTYREYFQPVLEGASNWNFGGVAWIDISVVTPYTASYFKQSDYPPITANGIASSYIMYKNIGTAYWYDDLTAPTNNTQPVRLATAGPTNRNSVFSASWPSTNRASNNFAMVYAADGITPSQFQHVVRPGEIVKFEFDLTAKDSQAGGTYRELFHPVLDGATNWYMGGLAWTDVTIANRTGSAQLHSQSSFPTSTPGQQNQVFLSYKNNTNYVWYDNQAAPRGLQPFHLSTTRPINRYSMFSFGWPSAQRPALTFNKVFEADGLTLTTNQNVVLPGQIGRYDFNLSSPWSINPGTYREYFQPLLEGSANWNVGGVSWLDITVQ